MDYYIPNTNINTTSLKLSGYIVCQALKLSSSQALSLSLADQRLYVLGRLEIALG
jgi:hypothetical protein